MAKESKERKKFGLAVTCAASRHAEMIAEELVKRGLSRDIQDDPKFAGESIRAAVHALWRARAQLKGMEKPVSKRPRDTRRKR